MSAPISAFLDYQMLSAVSRAALGGWGEEGWREGGNPSLCRNGRECFKTVDTYELFSLSGKHLCNCWWPWLPTQGPEKGEDEGQQGNLSGRGTSLLH